MRKDWFDFLFTRRSWGHSGMRTSGRRPRLPFRHLPPAALPPAGNRRLFRLPVNADAGSSRCRSVRPHLCRPRSLFPVRPRGADAGQRAMRTFVAADKSAAGRRAQKVRVAVTAAAAATQRGRDLHADQCSAWGPRHEGFVETAKAGQHRSALSRRLDHRLVGAGRREQGDVRQVFRQIQDRELCRRRRYDAGRAVGPAERRGPGLSAEGRSC